MFGNVAKVIRAAWRWLSRRPAYLLLTADDDRLGAERPERFTYAWVDLILLSVGWSVASVGIWGAAWRLFGDYDLIVMPALVFLSVFALWPFRRALVAVSEVLAGRDKAAQALVSALLVVILALCLVRMKSDPEYSGQILPPALAWLRPNYQLYRVLVLMPLWGGWAMLITGQFCPPADRTEPAVASFSRGAGPLIAATCMGALLAMTILYFNFLPWWQLSISGAAIVTATAGGQIICRCGGGLSRRGLLATDLLTQLAFILAYLANVGSR